MPVPTGTSKDGLKGSFSYRFTAWVLRTKSEASSPFLLGDAIFPGVSGALFSRWAVQICVSIRSQFLKPTSMALACVGASFSFAESRS